MILELITTDFLVNISLLVILLSFVVIIVSVVLMFRKTKEEASAAEIMKRLADLKKGKAPQKKEKKLEIKPGETSLKDLLTKKFQPKIESQLKTKVNVIDFNAKDENFLALIDISGVKILLTLDSSGKIIDYKKVKKK